jgi:hypothetical protein
MKEKSIRKKVVDRLEKKGFICWYAAKAKFQSNDIFNVFDVIAVKGKELKFIQLTSCKNTAARRKKINKFLKETGADLDWAIWCYDTKNRVLKIWRNKRLKEEEKRFL